MDIVYFLKASPLEDLELRYSLRSVARNFPDVGKIWIFGDRPSFLSSDKTLIEHVTHESIGDAVGIRAPITNFFQLFFCASLIPDLSADFLWFCDDFVVLRPITVADAATVRFLEDLDHVNSRGKGIWLDSLWRTYDILKRLKYPRLNFETHAPTYFRKKWVFDAYRDFKDWITRDRWLGMLGPTAILNHALKAGHFTPVPLNDPKVRAGFFGKGFQRAEIEAEADGRLFLGYDDRAFSPALLAFLHECFPERCRYESESNAESVTDVGYFQAIAGREI